MAKFANVFIPSVVQNHSWNCHVYRSFSGQIVATATEGELSHGMFTTEVFSSRRIRIDLDAKRLTAKVNEQGLAQLRAKLIEDKLILNDA